MTPEIIKALEGLFTFKNDKWIFTDEALKQDSLLHATYELVSEVMRASDIGFNFSYEIAQRAVSVITECEDLDNETLFNECVESNTPIYTNEIMQIYLQDYAHVDDYMEEIGQSDMDSVTKARMTWAHLIETMAREIIAKLTN